MSLKKILKPPEENPPELLLQSANTIKKNPIPPSVFYNKSLKELNGFKNLRSTLKRDAFLDEFIQQGIEALSAYVVDDTTHYDYEVVKFMCQTAEDIFIKYNKQGSDKKHAVIQVCKKYFDDNEVLTAKIIEQVLPTISKSSLFRRNKTRLYNIGVFFLGLFLNKSNNQL